MIPNCKKIEEATITQILDNIIFKAGSSQNYLLRKKNNIVSLNLPVNFGENIPNEMTAIARLPIGFRPKENLSFAIGLGSDGGNGWTIEKTGIASLYADGYLHIRNSTGNEYKYAFINISFIVD